MADNKNFRLITDSACDLSDETLNALRIDVVPFYIAFDNENYLKEGSEMTSELLYKKMEEMPDVFPKTSLPSVSDYMAVLSRAPQQARMLFVFVFHQNLAVRTTVRVMRHRLWKKVIRMPK